MDPKKVLILLFLLMDLLGLPLPPAAPVVGGPHDATKASSSTTDRHVLANSHCPLDRQLLFIKNTTSTINVKAAGFPAKGQNPAWLARSRHNRERKDRFLCPYPPLPSFRASRMLLPFFLESAGAGPEHPPPVFPRAPGAHRAQGLHCQQGGPLQTAVGVRNEAGTESLLSVDRELISFIVRRKHILNRGPHFRSSLGWSLPLLHSPYPRFAMLTSVVAEAYRIVAVVRHT